MVKVALVTVTEELANDAVESRISRPSRMTVEPVNVFVPDRVRAFVPSLTIPPAPVIAPAMVPAPSKRAEAPSANVIWLENTTELAKRTVLFVPATSRRPEVPKAPLLAISTAPESTNTRPVKFVELPSKRMTPLPSLRISPLPVRPAETTIACPSVACTFTASSPEPVVCKVAWTVCVPSPLALTTPPSPGSIVPLVANSPVSESVQRSKRATPPWRLSVTARYQVSPAIHGPLKAEPRLNVC